MTQLLDFYKRGGIKMVDRIEAMIILRPLSEHGKTKRLFLQANW